MASACTARDRVLVKAKADARNGDEGGRHGTAMALTLHESKCEVIICKKSSRFPSLFSITIDNIPLWYYQ